MPDTTAPDNIAPDNIAPDSTAPDSTAEKTSEQVPAGASQNPAAENAESTFTSELPGRLLIVEDDPALRLLLKRSFAGCDVFVAENGARGLESIHRDQPDFVITDLMMPEMGGLEMIKRARATSLGACVPIMVLTSRTEEQVLLDCFRYGANDFMVKPFSMAELRVRVQSIFLRQRIAQDANPLTRLPGNDILKREIEARIRVSEETAVAYVDLDHFKEFNDTFGFDRGDRVIQLVGDVLSQFAAAQSPGEVFVGHIGGDDFVAVLDSSKVNDLAENLFAQFDVATEALYSDETLKQGFYRARNRKGEDVEIPLVSISIGVILGRRKGMTDLRLVSQVAAEVKKMAKKTQGNSVFFDRRTE